MNEAKDPSMTEGSIDTYCLKLEVIMETFELVINIPTLDEIIGWFVCWFCFGVMFNVIHSIAFVSCDYGRTVRSMSGIALFAMVILDSLFWFANIKSIRDNISVDRFNREYKHYR